MLMRRSQFVGGSIWHELLVSSGGDCLAELVASCLFEASVASVLLLTGWVTCCHASDSMLEVLLGTVWALLLHDTDSCWTEKSFKTLAACAYTPHSMNACAIPQKSTAAKNVLAMCF